MLTFRHLLFDLFIPLFASSLLLLQLSSCLVKILMNRLKEHVLKKKKKFHSVQNI